MVIGGKIKAVQKSCYPLGFSSQEEWERYASSRHAQYAWRLLVLDKEIDETEYRHMQTRLFLTMKLRNIDLARTDQNSMR